MTQPKDGFILNSATALSHAYWHSHGREWPMRQCVCDIKSEVSDVEYELNLRLLITMLAHRVSL